MTADTLASKLVTANRVLTNEGILNGFGHITVREPGAEELLVSSYQSSALVTEADLIRMDLDGNVLGSDAETYSETAIHRAIYRAREDVNAVVHHHAPAVMPFTITDVEVRPAFHQAAIFSDGVPLFDDYDDSAYGRLIVGREESDRMAAALGDCRAQLLEGHGANVVGSSIEQAVVTSVFLVMNCEFQRAAMEMGEPRYYTGPAEGVESLAAAVIERPRTVRRLWDHLAARLPTRRDG